MTNPNDELADPRDFRKRLTDHLYNVEHEIKTLHDAIEKGDKSLIYQHDFRMAYRMGLINSLRIFDQYQAELWQVVKEKEAGLSAEEPVENTECNKA